MKIKRYVDTDMRHVLRRVRQDQGPDAVILSNRRVDDGIEVIAAIDYDEALIQQAVRAQPAGGGAEAAAGASDEADHRESREEASRAASAGVAAAVASTLEPTQDADRDDGHRHRTPPSEASLADVRSELSSLRELVESQFSGLLWKDGARRSPMRAQILRNLARLGVAPDVANIVVNRLEPIQEVKQIWRSPLAELAQLIPTSADRLLSDGGTVALIGPTGVGKTTTIAKIAARYSMQHGSDDVALICADAYRIGAREHLTAFGNIIGVKVHAASTSAELSSLLDRLRSKRLILIDTEGMSQRDIDLSDRLAAYGRNEERVRFYLTLSAAGQEAALDETIRRFKKVPLSAAIVTKIDEAAQLGCVISVLIRHDLPAVWLSDGQRVPDDLHAAARKKLMLVNRAVECMEASDPRVDEVTMAERYAQVSIANA